MRLINLAIKDIKQILRDWKSALFLVLMPILFTVFFGLIFNFSGEGEQALPVAFPQNASAQAGAAQFLELLQTADAIQAQAVDLDSPAALEEAVRQGDFAGALLFANDFEDKVAARQGVALTVITDNSQPAGQTVQEAIEKTFDRYLSSLDIVDLSAQLYEERAGQGAQADQEFQQEGLSLAVAAWQDPPIEINSVMGGAKSAEVEMGFSQSSPGMIVQFAIFGLITSAMVLVLERKSGAMKRLLTTPLSRVELVGGHVLAMFTIVLLQQLLLVLLGQFIFGVSYDQSPLAIFVMILVLAFWAASLGLFIGAIAKSEEQVVTISLLAMFIFAALGGAWFPLEFAGQAFSTVGHLMPTAWAMDGFQNVIVRGFGLNSVLLPAGLLAAYGLVFFALAVWRFRYE